MATPSLLQAWDLTVGLDYGQFHLQTDDPYNAAKTETARVVEQALGGPGIAQHFGLIVVLSPHQNNFKMDLRVEVWDGHPVAEDHWQESFETDLTVGRGGLVYDSPALSSFAIPVPPGLYHLQIDGRGFSEHGWPGSTTPGDNWRLRLWPCEEGHSANRLSSWTDSLPRRVDVAE